MITAFVILAVWLIVLSFMRERVKDKVELQAEQISGLSTLLCKTRQSLDRSEAAKALGIHNVG